MFYRGVESGLLQTVPGLDITANPDHGRQQWLLCGPVEGGPAQLDVLAVQTVGVELQHLLHTETSVLSTELPVRPITLTLPSSLESVDISAQAEHSLHHLSLIRLTGEVEGSVAVTVHRVEEQPDHLTAVELPGLEDVEDGHGARGGVVEDVTADDVTALEL